MQPKSIKNAVNAQTQAKNNKHMKKYETYQVIVEANQMPNSDIN